MTIKRLLAKASKILEHESQTPILDSEVLLAFVLNRDKSYLIAHSSDKVDSKNEIKFIRLIERRKLGEPIAYLTGSKEFYGLGFLVNKSVLIPRPETEQLVDMAFEEVKKRALRLRSRRVKSGKREIRIIDVGTGSGNIGVTLTYLILKNKLNNRIKFIVYMSEVSGKALMIAKKNLKRLVPAHQNIELRFVKADLLKGFNSKFDIIVSNPPYIPSGDIDLLDRNVRDFEPHIALSGGELGMKYIRRLISQSIKRLASSGKLLLEIHENHPERIRLYLEENFPKWRAKFKKDVFGQWRFAIVYLQ